MYSFNLVLRITVEEVGCVLIFVFMVLLNNENDNQKPAKISTQTAGAFPPYCQRENKIISLNTRILILYYYAVQHLFLKSVTTSNIKSTLDSTLMLFGL
uniref:Uncharacterized protein n=1 Tax=Glossina palpalis gambiensis TaxID=67801 RepID=A0A1B0BAH3_9MUSC